MICYQPTQVLVEQWWLKWRERERKGIRLRSISRRVNRLNWLILRGSMATRTIGVASWCRSVNAGHATVLDNAADFNTQSSNPPMPTSGTLAYTNITSVTATNTPSLLRCDYCPAIILTDIQRWNDNDERTDAKHGNESGGTLLIFWRYINIHHTGSAAILSTTITASVICHLLHIMRTKFLVYCLSCTVTWAV